MHIFGELVHIFGELAHIFDRKLVSNFSKQVSRNLGPLWQPGVYNDTKAKNMKCTLSDLLSTRVWCIPEFGAEIEVPFFRFSAVFNDARVKTQPAPNPSTHQSPVETLSDTL